MPEEPRPVLRQTDDASTSFSADFARGCAVEAGADPAWLSTYGSEHIAGDIEAIRASLGIERLAVYGVSYGTVIAQRYASAHPDRVSPLILDGPVDPAQGSQAGWVEADKAFEATLARVFDACLADDACRRDLPDPQGDARAAARPGRGDGIETSYADITGRVRDVTLDRGSIISAIDDALYDPLGRSLFLHALASRRRRATTSRSGAWSPRRVTTRTRRRARSSRTTRRCARTSPATRPTTPPATSATARPRARWPGRSGRPTTRACPCVDWGGRTPERPTPAPLTDTPFPVVVLSGGADPITPPSQAARIAARLSDGYLITTVDGGHGSFGNGEPCPDDAVAALLLRGDPPGIADHHLRRPAHRDLHPAAAVVPGTRPRRRSRAPSTTSSGRTRTCATRRRTRSRPTSAAGTAA